MERLDATGGLLIANNSAKSHELNVADFGVLDGHLARVQRRQIWTAYRTQAT